MILEGLAAAAEEQQAVAREQVQEHPAAVGSESQALLERVEAH